MVINKQLLLCGVVVLFLLSGVFMSVKTRGLRNNNPLNIEYNKRNDWDGQTGVEALGRFATFSDMKYGVRAGAKLIKTYMDRHGLRTVYGVVQRWAPDFENPTNAYADYVANGIGISPYDLVDAGDIPEIIKYMIRFESGSFIDESIIDEGCRLAGV